MHLILCLDIITDDYVNLTTSMHMSPNSIFIWNIRHLPTQLCHNIYIL